MLQAFLVATRLGEPGFGFALRLFGALQLHRSLLAALLERGESILQAFASGMVPGQRLFDPAQQLLQFVLADETMTLWRQLLEQGEDAAGVGQVFLLRFGLLQLRLGGIAFVLQAHQIGQPLALLLQGLELLLRASQRVLLLAMAGFERLPCFGFQWLQTAELLLQLGEGFAGALGRFERGLAEAAVETGVGELFQQGAALIIPGLQKSTELALREENSSSELSKVEPKLELN